MHFPSVPLGRRHAVLQQNATDCAAACLATVVQHYGKSASVSQLRLLCGTDRNGTTVFGLVKAAKSIGFACRAVKCGPEHLPGLEVPAIAHVIHKQRNHFVVL